MVLIVTDGEPEIHGNGISARRRRRRSSDTRPNPRPSPSVRGSGRGRPTRCRSPSSGWGAIRNAPFDSRWPPGRGARGRAGTDGLGAAVVSDYPAVGGKPLKLPSRRPGICSRRAPTHMNTEWNSPVAIEQIAGVGSLRRGSGGQRVPIARLAADRHCPIGRSQYHVGCAGNTVGRPSRSNPPMTPTIP